MLCLFIVIRCVLVWVVVSSMVCCGVFIVRVGCCSVLFIWVWVRVGLVIVRVVMSKVVVRGFDRCMVGFV